jgi:hypothetical protein
MLGNRILNQANCFRPWLPFGSCSCLALVSCSSVQVSRRCSPDTAFAPVLTFKDMLAPNSKSPYVDAKSVNLCRMYITTH